MLETDDNHDGTPRSADLLDAYVAQIEAEDRLVGQRMGWMLQFNGFLFASYGLALRTVDISRIAERFVSTVPFVGIAVVFFGVIGIWAALAAQNDKRKQWLAWVDQLSAAEKIALTTRPLFQSNARCWYASQVSGYGTCLTMLVFWVWVAIPAYK